LTGAGAGTGSTALAGEHRAHPRDPRCVLGADRERRARPVGRRRQRGGAANAGVALMLYRHRRGDANMRSAWMCPRNDAVGNFAVMRAAAGAIGTGTGWPDIVVAAAAAMATLGLSGGCRWAGRRRRTRATRDRAWSRRSSVGHRGGRRTGTGMHTHSTTAWRHDHTFGQDRPRAGERRTLVVLALTAATMVAEIAAGLAFGSVALLADGLHMGSHATALGIAAAAYAYARRRAADPRFAFGTGKVNALGGYTGAVLLAAFALAMAGEGVLRLADPVPTAFDAAIAVAAVGLAVNAASVLILGGHGHDPHEPGHGHGRSGRHGGGPDRHQPHRGHHHRAFDPDHHHDREHRHDHGRGHDLNLRAAYLHVLADALTSMLAIVALLAGKFLGAWWMDPLTGLLGAALVARWSWGLLRETGRVLLDRQAQEAVREAVRGAVEGAADNRLYDLHVWSVAPGAYAAALGVVTHAPRPPEHYKALLPTGLGVVHATVEVQECREAPTHRRAA
jgi:cation diffusion facilitator family transporter